MGYTRKKPSSALERILNNCDDLKRSLSRLGKTSRFSGLSGGFLRNVEVKSDTELELTCSRSFDKKDIVLKIEAVIDDFGKACLIVTKQ